MTAPPSFPRSSVGPVTHCAEAQHASALCRIGPILQDGIFRRRLPILLLVAVACAHPSGLGTPPPAAGPYDVVIEGGRVVDGAGNPWFYGDVAIQGDRIARIAPAGLLAQAAARRRIDAHGLVVAPGIIDIQAQSDAELLRGDSRVISMVTQGVTTMIMGEGETPAPANDKIMAMYRVTDTAEARLFRSFAGAQGFAHWLDAMARHGASVNFGSFLGAGTVRAYAKAQAEGPASPAERDTMRADGKLLERLRDSATRAALAAEMVRPDAAWENLCLSASPEVVEVVGFTLDSLKRYEGQRLSQIARTLWKTWPETIIDLTLA